MAIKKISRCPKCHTVFASSRSSRLCDACYYQETTVVNWQQERFDVYIGRFNYRASLLCASSPNITSDLIHLSSKGFFGNPFRVNVHGREEALRKFRKYFYERLANDETFLARVLDLKGLVLGCWCKPKPCHGDIMADFLNAIEDSTNPLEVKRIIKQRRTAK